MKRFILTLLVLALAATPVWAADLTADQIVQKADEVVNAPKCMHLTSTMTVAEKGQPEKVRQLNVWQAEGKRLVRFVQPASEAGIALLSTDSETNYVYRPAFEKVRRIAAHVRNQTFLGTDFTQEDMATAKYFKEYAPKLLSQTADAWTLELTRRPESKAGYGKLVVDITKDHFLFTKIEYYDAGGQKLKTEVRSNPKIYNDKYWILHNLVMTNAKDGHQTKLEMSNLKMDENLPADFFSQRTLKRAE